MRTDLRGLTDVSMPQTQIKKPKTEIMSDLDTIAAVSTPPGEGGIGIIRISGSNAFDCAGRVFFPAGERQKPLKERYLHYGLMKDAGGRVLDNGCVVLMKGPASYTGEDVAELQCHGSTLVLREVLASVLKAGARLAEPGEFTKRAFLAGKLDLAQAEAVIDIIRASTRAALASARGRLGGAFSRRVEEIKETLVELLAGIEAELDFPEEEEVEPMASCAIIEVLERAEERLEKLLATFDEGRALREGVRVLILGRPNVGKSSLLNLLLDEQRAIVTPVPGTTRDVIEEVVNIRGLPVRLMDTAGLRDTADPVESIGVANAREKVKDASLVLYVVDASEPSSFHLDIEELARVGKEDDAKVIVIANKSDLAGKQKDAAEKAFEGFLMTHTCAVDGAGLAGLKDAIFASVVHRAPDEEAQTPAGELVASLRHSTALSGALEGVVRAREAATNGVEKEFVATDVRWAVDRLGEITGETTTEDILERIFSTFCIGK